MYFQSKEAGKAKTTCGIPSGNWELGWGTRVTWAWDWGLVRLLVTPCPQLTILIPNVQAQH